MDLNSNEFDDFENDSMMSDSPFKHSILPSFKQTVVVIIIFLIILIILEKIFAELFYLIFPSYFILIIVEIILHLLLIRYFIYLSIFPGQNTLVEFYVRKAMGRLRGSYFNSSLNRYKTKIDKLISEAIIKNNNNNESSFHSQKKISSQFLETYDLMLKKYGKISNISQTFYNKLTELKNSIESCNIQEKMEKLKKKDEIFITEKDKEDYNNIKLIIGNIQIMLKDYLGTNEFELKSVWKNIQNYFCNDLLSSKEFIRCSSIIKKQNSLEMEIPTKDGNKIDSILLFSESQKGRKNSTNLVIISGPNLTPYENLINSWDLDSLYLYNDTDVLFWNYRGYGFSTGYTSFDTITSDSLTVYDYITEHFNYKKIAAHGLSIGGLPACYLGNHKYINLLIADRTFGSAEGVIMSLPLGKYIKYLAKILFIPLVDNTKSFMETKCEKILMNDAEDKTVVDPMSLKSLISQEIIYKIFNEMEPELNLRRINSKFILDYALEPDEAENIFPCFKFTIEFLKKKNPRNLFNSEQINRTNEFNQKLNEENLTISMKEGVDIFYNKIKSLYTKFNCVGDYLERFCEFQNNLTHFKNFFNNLVIYGPDDQSFPQYSLCNISYTDGLLKSFIDEADEFLNSSEASHFEGYELHKKFSYFVNCIKNLRRFIMSMNLDKMDQDWIKAAKGKLIPLYCGHISFYDDKEFETLKYLTKEALNNSDVIIPPQEI